jgi:hypothetical protein
LSPPRYATFLPKVGYFLDRVVCVNPFISNVLDITHFTVVLLVRGLSYYPSHCLETLKVILGYNLGFKNLLNAKTLALLTWNFHFKTVPLVFVTCTGLNSTEILYHLQIMVV